VPDADENTSISGEVVSTLTALSLDFSTALDSELGTTSETFERLPISSEGGRENCFIIEKEANVTMDKLIARNNRVFFMILKISVILGLL
tara:strand:- start:241 stop:510 length:270 start_codon:yes stop_codon:yes gene_type:complete